MGSVVSGGGEDSCGGRLEDMLGAELAGKVDQVYDATESVGYELSGHSALFQGDFKIVLNRPPRGDGQWHLFDIVKDPGETRDLRGVMPAQFQSMLTAYERYAVDNKVLPMPEADYRSMRHRSNYKAMKCASFHNQSWS